MAHFVEAEIFQACRLLFGTELRLNHDFLRYLQPKGAKTAYRQRAKEHHPDRFACQAPQVHGLQVRRFQDINKAYDLIVEFMDQRKADTLPLGAAPQAQPRRPARQRPAASTHHPGTKPDNAYYSGPLPRHRLEFGLFLYYRGRITFRTLITAINWQRQQRPNLGDIALRWGWMNALQIEDICRSRARSRAYKRFGERAVELRVINPQQLQTLLYYQRSLQKRLGEYFVENNLLSRVELQQLLNEQKNHNRQFTHSGFHPSF